MDADLSDEKFDAKEKQMACELTSAEGKLSSAEDRSETICFSLAATSSADRSADRIIEVPGLAQTLCKLGVCQLLREVRKRPGHDLQQP